ncbi:MAG: low molecular weight phosphotyrosine protein phosphatase [Opitutales bacterium]|nr:low molecular weight phosphotyrosine protein phosphatase [Opitutales bacterium]
MDYRVLFVCMGNICRSPAAECVFRKRLKNEGLDARVDCDSAGTIAYHSGEPPDARMSDELTRRGIPVSGRARGVSPDDLATFDLVLAMDRENLAHLRRLAGGDAPAENVRLFCEFCRENNAEEVPDPYYGGRSGFSEVADLIEDGCDGLIDEIRRKLDG